MTYGAAVVWTVFVMMLGIVLTGFGLVSFVGGGGVIAVIIIGAGFTTALVGALRVAARHDRSDF